MQTTIFFDCEFLTREGALSRLWFGPRDPDPVVVQFGAVRLALQDNFPILDRMRRYIQPRDRHGNTCALEPYFTQLTGVTEDDLRQHGMPLEDALRDLSEFAGPARLWSWGKDEFYLMALSCYIAGVPPPLPATRFGNVSELILHSGMPYDTVIATRSNQLAAAFGVAPPGLRKHDALDDALSIAHAVQHLLQNGKLAPETCL